MTIKFPVLRGPDTEALPAGLPSASGRMRNEPLSFLRVLDGVALAIAFGAAYLVVPGLKDFLLRDTGALRDFALGFSPAIGGQMPGLIEVGWVWVVMVASTLLFVQSVGGYRSLVSQSPIRLALASLVGPLAGLSTIALILFALRNPTWSRLFVFLFAVFAVVGLFAYRMLLRWYRLQRTASGAYACNVILVGSPSGLGWLLTHIANNTSRNEYDIVGYLSASAMQQPLTSATDRGTMVIPFLGQVSQLATLLISRPIHEVIVVQGASSEWLRGVVETCDFYRITLRIVPETLVFGGLHDLQILYHSDSLRLPEIVLQPRHFDSSALFIKRVIDIVGSLFLLVLLSPLFALIAAAIKITTPRLPVFYAWKVVGYNGRRFTGYKFSSMVENADEQQPGLMPDNQMQGPVFKIRNDPRITLLGRLLRKFSLNELPQLWSVLKGDMSLVGPRPAFPHELERYELWHKRKLCVQPGMTCLWQVRGRNKISRFDDWVRMDFEYIDKWSLWLDIKILARTVLVVLQGSGW